MTITYPLTFPSHTGVRSITFRQVTASRLTESPFTFKQQSITHTGQRWEADIMLPPMKNADARQWIAWLSSLRGHNGTFAMGDPLGNTPRGSAGGTPLIAGASQTGGSVNIDGAAVSQTDWLMQGDYLQIGTGDDISWHICLTDVDTNGAGEATIDLWPDIRTAHADNTAITLSNTVGLWRLASNQMMWNADEASVYGLSFTAVEAIQ